MQFKRLAKVGGRSIEYDFVSSEPFEHKKKMLVLISIGKIESINGTPMSSDDKYVYVYKNKIETLDDHPPRVIMHKRYLNTRDMRVETLDNYRDDKMVTDVATVHKDYFKEFYKLIKE